jgi:hypothetical protein
MGKAFLYGSGGGAGLNFDVKGYQTEAELLAAAPKANTIGVVTAEPITGWIFDTNEPADLVNGMLWFPTGKTSIVEFNALKKNGVQVYPLSAKQYISGVLVDVDAATYRGGEWVDWVEIYLVNSDAFRAETAYGGSTGTYSFSEDGYYGMLTNKLDCSVVSKEKINLTDIKYITAPYSLNLISGNLANYADGRFSLCIASGNSALGEDGTPPIVSADASKSSSGELKLDTSSLKGEYYIWILFATWTTSFKAEATVGDLSFYR